MMDGRGGGGGGREEGAGEQEALEWRLELFRRRRAKRVVFRAWRGAARTAAAVAVLEEETRRNGGAESGGRGHGEGRRRGLSRSAATGRDDELTACSEWGARLRTAEVK